MRYLFARKGNYWQDSWTYGDWRQYIVPLQGCDSICVRRSQLPLLISFLGGLFATFGIICMATMPVEAINWVRAIPFTAIGIFAAAASWLIEAMGYSLMKAVGPVNRDGHRVLNGDK